VIQIFAAAYAFLADAALAVTWNAECPDRHMPCHCRRAPDDLGVSFSVVDTN